MKNMTQKLANKNIDPIADARKSEKFQQYSKDVVPRIRFAVEVYNSRNAMGLSQKTLAKEINSTQKVISKVENGDMNLGIELLNRFVERLNFNSDTLARVFNCGQAYRIFNVAAESKTKNEQMNIGGNESLFPAICATMGTGIVVTSSSSQDIVLGSNNTKYINK